MSTASIHRKTKPSNRLAHGLTSKARTEEWREEAERLARDIVGDGPVTAEVLETATALAQSIILVEATRREKWSAVRKSERLRKDRQSCQGSHTLDGNGAATMSNMAVTELVNEWDVVSSLTLEARELRRLDDLERRATSRRNRLLRRLDFQILEERRRRIRPRSQ